MRHHPRALSLAVLLLTACGPGSKGVHPGPEGTAVVLFEADGRGGLVPLACYDPLWVELRGPRDCADLVPPGARVRLQAGGLVEIADRGPAPCGVHLVVSGPAHGPGLGEWAADGRPRLGPSGIDLDGDGSLEVVSREGDHRVVLGAPVGEPDASLGASAAPSAARRVVIRGCPLLE